MSVHYDDVSDNDCKVTKHITCYRKTNIYKIIYGNKFHRHGEVLKYTDDVYFIFVYTVFIVKSAVCQLLHDPSNYYENKKESTLSITQLGAYMCMCTHICVFF